MAVPRPAEELFSFERLERASDDDRYEPTEKDEFAPPSEGIKGEIVHVSARHLTKDIRIPGVRIRDKVTYYDDGSVASPQRDPAWVTIVTAFHDEISAKRKRFDDFWSFVERHPLANHIGPWLGRAERRAKTSTLNRTTSSKLSAADLGMTDDDVVAVVKPWVKS